MSDQEIPDSKITISDSSDSDSDRRRSSSAEANTEPIKSISLAEVRKPPVKDFFLRYYVGHHGKFGHEFNEIIIRHSVLRLVNLSGYGARGQGQAIRKEVVLGPVLEDEVKKIIRDSTILERNDEKWPEASREGKQEIEIVLDGEHICFITSKLNSLAEVQRSSADVEGLSVLYYLAQDLRSFSKSVMDIHTKVNPI